jgi:DNA-binding transcriptional LysR family regulator
MPKITQWDRHIGRHLRLRDLFVLLTVVESGSMTKAAAQLGVSTPSVSALIAALEHELATQLLDRTPKGVLPTLQGETLLARARAAFDELRQGIQDLEFMSDPSAGQVRIGCPESISAFLVFVIERLARDYPRIRLHVQQVHWPPSDFPELRDRGVDVVLARLASPPTGDRLGENLDADVLFDDPFVVVVGSGNKLARRRKVDLAELVDEPWIVTPRDVLAGRFVSDAFEARGLTPPTPRIETSSIHLRNNLAARDQFLAVLPRSVLRLGAQRYGLKELPIRLSARPSPVAMVTLRGRALNPAVHVFIKYARETAKSFAFEK